MEANFNVWEPDDTLGRIEAGLAIIKRDDQDEPYCDSDRYYEIHEAVTRAASKAGEAEVLERLGTLPQRYQAANRGIRKLLAAKLESAKKLLASTRRGRPKGSKGERRRKIEDALRRGDDESEIAFRNDCSVDYVQSICREMGTETMPTVT